MILFICIGFYLIIGVLFNFIHPEITELNPILKRVYRPTIGDYIRNGRYNPWWKRFSAVVLIRVIMIVVGPVTSIIDLVSTGVRRLKKEEEDYDYLYFSMIKGAGEVICVDCGYKTTLTGYVVGGPGSDWNQKGYQCQSCGQFHEIEFTDRLDQLPGCQCGGKITRNEYVFCPECRSDHLIYRMQYVEEVSS